MPVLIFVNPPQLDIIGLSGFDYSFGALDDEKNPLVEALHSMLRPRQPVFLDLVSVVLSQCLPFFPSIPTQVNKAESLCFRLMKEEGARMLEARLEQATLGTLENRQDLMSVIVKANLDPRNHRDRLYDDELAGILSTFVVAGVGNSAIPICYDEIADPSVLAQA